MCGYFFTQRQEPNGSPFRGLPEALCWLVLTRLLWGLFWARETVALA